MSDTSVKQKSCHPSKAKRLSDKYDPPPQHPRHNSKIPPAKKPSKRPAKNYFILHRDDRIVTLNGHTLPLNRPYLLPGGGGCRITLKTSKKGGEGNFEIEYCNSGGKLRYRFQLPHDHAFYKLGPKRGEYLKYYEDIQGLAHFLKNSGLANISRRIKFIFGESLVFEHQTDLALDSRSEFFSNQTLQIKSHKADGFVYDTVSVMSDAKLGETFVVRFESHKLTDRERRKLPKSVVAVERITLYLFAAFDQVDTAALYNYLLSFESRILQQTA